MRSIYSTRFLALYLSWGDTVDIMTFHSRLSLTGILATRWCMCVGGKPLHATEDPYIRSCEALYDHDGSFMCVFYLGF